MNSRELDFKFIEKENIKDVVKLMEEVLSNIPDKSIYSTDEEHELIELIDEGGSIIGVYDGDKLVAFRSLKVPSKEDKENNLSYDVKNFYIDPETVVINDSVAVLEDYRGMNLQNITRTKIEERYDHSKYTNRMSTISPINPNSYMNTLSSGYAIVALKKKYADEDNPEGHDRFILLKSRDIKFEFTGSEKKINCENIEEIKSAIEDNYFGFSVDDDGSILFKQVRII